jgi:hypothetical protein
MIIGDDDKSEIENSDLQEISMNSGSILGFIFSVIGGIAGIAVILFVGFLLSVVFTMVCCSR